MKPGLGDLSLKPPFLSLENVYTHWHQLECPLKLVVGEVLKGVGVGRCRRLAHPCPAACLSLIQPTRAEELQL